MFHIELDFLPTGRDSPRGGQIAVQQLGKMGRQLKYASILSKLTDCPPAKGAPLKREAFRFVKSIHNESFLPVGVMNPRRLNHPNAQLCCSSAALSMFTSEGAARAKYKQLCSDHPNFAKIAGNQLAKGELHEQDGVQTEPTKAGHIDLHEYAGSNLLRRFKIVGEL
jgi:hypothetical protein